MATIGVIQDSVVIPANGKNDNVLDGKRNRRVPAEAQKGVFIDLYATGSAAGLYTSLFVAGRNPIERSGVNAQNRFPVEEQDRMAQGIPGAPTDELQLSVENTTAGALTFFFKIVLDNGI